MHEPSSHPYPQAGYQNVSQEDINSTFSAADWDGKLNSGDEDFRPTEGREKKSPSRTSRTRARSVDKGRMNGNSEPIDLTSDSDAPQAPDTANQIGGDRASMPTEQAFQAGNFLAEEWTAKLSGSQAKTPKRPSKSSSARRPTTSTKINTNTDKLATASNHGSETVIPGVSGFDPTTDRGTTPNGAAAADAMDIDDSLSDTVPLNPPTNAGLHNSNHAAAPRNQLPTPTDVDLNNLANVAPFAPSSTGLKDMDDISTHLPFESRPAPAVNLNKPVPGSSSNLRLPKPPKPIIPPSGINQLSWERYVAEMNAYFYDWNVFNKKMIEHFRSRQEQVDMSMASHWISMAGDGRPPEDLQGGQAGYATYMAWLEEDTKCREWWNVANERNRECFENLGKMRAKVKAASAATPSSW